MTSSPCAFRALALASTASVADSAMAAMLSGDPRCTDLPCWHSDRVARPPARYRSPRPSCPADGRFGCGPSKVPTRGSRRPGRRRPAPRHVAPPGPGQAPVVGGVRAGLHDAVRAARRLGGRAGQRRLDVFWDVATFGLIEPTQPAPGASASSPRSSRRRPRPRRTSSPPDVIDGARGTHPMPTPRPDVDLYALTHNETSTGVMMPLGGRPEPTGLVAVDATSGAGGLPWSPARGRRLLLRPAEVLRLRRRAVARAVLARRGRAHRADQRRRAAGSRPRST